MTESDRVSIRMFENLIANIKRGNITILDREGEVVNVDGDSGTIELRILIEGDPDINIMEG